MGMRPPPSYDRVCTLLRHHREQMRVVEDVLFDEFFDGSIEELIIQRTGRLMEVHMQCGQSDPVGGDAPETVLWRERALAAMPFKDQAIAEQRFLLAVSGLAQHKAMEEKLARVQDELSRARLDLERARMRSEDHSA
jgi:hypothetical protein